MRQFLIILGLILLSVASGLIGLWIGKGEASPTTLSPIEKIKPKPLEKYTIDNLSTRTYAPSEIKIEQELQTPKNANYTSYLFSFQSDGKKVTGQINLPSPRRSSEAEAGPYPIILMFRGYVDQKEYQTGKGTKNAAAFFAENGFITIAPDFLGYGGSDPINPDIMEARFETYTTVLNLLATIENTSEIVIPNEKCLPSTHATRECEAGPPRLGEAGSLQTEVSVVLGQMKNKKLFLWGHSNGGQIALTTLEITKKEIPTVLWAPVTKPFPYSVLYYTDESDDRGKLLRHKIAEFEETYNPDLYSIDLYFDRINAPIQLHQGTADDAVPKAWSDQFVKKVKKLDKEITYHVYPGADHNLRPASQRGEPASPKPLRGEPPWDTVISRDLAFFKKHLK